MSSRECETLDVKPNFLNKIHQSVSFFKTLLSYSFFGFYGADYGNSQCPSVRFIRMPGQFFFQKFLYTFMIINIKCFLYAGNYPVPDL